MNAPILTRRGFTGGLGTLVVAFSLDPNLVLAQERLPGSLQNNRKLDGWIRINPDGIANQIEGGAIQATSWTLKEAVRFDRERVTSDSWQAYPILRCSEAPAVDVDIVSRPDCPAVGAGEAAQGPTAAAIANAVFDALGIRMRELPLTAERIRAAIG